MFKMIVATFEDPNGFYISTEIPIYESESDANVIAEDLATEWYYDIANDQFGTFWRENGGSDIDYEYEEAFDTYLANSSLEWNQKE